MVTNGCGFCLTTYTCVPGDSSGPALRALPCPSSRNFTDRIGYQKDGSPPLGVWAADKATLDDINKNLRFPTPFELMRPPLTTYDECVPPEWDTLCVAGGHRHWGGCYLPYDDSKCHDGSTVWGSQYCECPSGRNGRFCGGCALGADPAAGCATGDTCERPNLLSLNDAPTRLGCRVTDPANVSFAFLATYVFGFGPLPSLDLELSASSFRATLTKAVNWPYGAFVWNAAPEDRGKAARLLGGMSFLAQANNSGAEEYLSTESGPCPTAGEPPDTWAFPFRKGEVCSHWRVKANMPTDRFFANTPMAKTADWHQFGWKRYEDVKILGGNLKPPLDFYCGTPAPNSSAVKCAMRVPKKPFMGVPFTINLDCEIEGRCTTPPPSDTPSPPPPPPPPPTSPPPDFGHYCALSDDHARLCTYLVLFGPLGGLAAALLALGCWRAVRAASVVCCNVCHARARGFRAMGRPRTPPSLSLLTPPALEPIDAPLLLQNAPPPSEFGPASELAVAAEQYTGVGAAAHTAEGGGGRPDTSDGTVVESPCGVRHRSGGHVRRPSEGYRAAAAFALTGAGSRPTPRSLRTTNVMRPIDGASPAPPSPGGLTPGGVPHGATMEGSVPVLTLGTLRELDGLGGRGDGARVCGATPDTIAGSGGGGGGSNTSRGRAAGSGSRLHHRRAVSAPIGVRQAEGWAASARPPSALSWRGVGYSVGRKALLPPCSGRLTGGLCAMIGPSGAGKSTLLGVLAGRKRKGEATGEVRLHGYRSSASVRRARVGYVTQDDLLPGTSTVEEHLAFHTLLRCPWLAAPARQALVDAALAAVALTPKADHIIGDGYVRGLSGGERRRVSVAVELLVAAARSARTAGSGGGVAPILLMDEPFSGLDSLNARLLLQALVEVAHGGGGDGGSGGGYAGDDGKAAGSSASSSVGGGGYGACVLLSVHQPTSRFMRSMASCLVMAPGGHVLYAGPTRTPEGQCAMSIFFDATRGDGPRLRELSPNSAEAVIELVSSTDDATRERLMRIVRAIDWSAGGDAADDGGGGRRARPIVGIGGSSSNAADAGLEEGWRQGAWSSDFWLQLWALTLRSWTLMLRHPLLFTSNLLATACVGLLCAWAFWRVDLTLSSGVLQRMGLLFFLGAHFLLTGLASLGVWRSEKLLYFHERGVGCYGTVPFVLSKLLLADALPMRILPALLISAIVYPTAGLNGIGATDGMPSDGPIKAATFVVSMCLTNLVGSAMFACIGILCSSTAVAVLLGVLYSLFTLLFSGFLANANQLPHTLGWLPYLSVLHYNFELVMSNELLGHDITVTKMWPGDPQAGQHQPVSGRMIVTDYLGFNRGWERECARVIPQPGGGHAVDQQISACWSDLYVPAMWYVGAVACACLLLKFCVRDPH